MHKVLTIALYFSWLGAQDKMITLFPVTNLRSAATELPQDMKGPALSQDMKGQVTQLLLGECVTAVPVIGKPGWVKVHALEQPGCSGLVKKDLLRKVAYFPKYNLMTIKPWSTLYKKPDMLDPILSVSIATKLLGAQTCSGKWRIALPSGQKAYIAADDIKKIADISHDVDLMRAGMVKKALFFVGSVYVWGGRTILNSTYTGTITGLDCSALINLLFRLQGLLVPRNAHTQYGTTMAIFKGSDLEPGDLVFFEDPEIRGFMSHVLMYLGDNKFIQSTGIGYKKASLAPDSTKLTTVLISTLDLFGKPLAKVVNGQSYYIPQYNACRTVYMGSLLKSQALIKRLRNEFMKIA